MMRTALCAIVLMAPAFAFGQQKFNASSFIELLRSDIRTKKVALVSKAMQFTDEEAAAFWPVYKNYDFELSKINDERLELLRDYAGNYETMTDKKAEELIKKVFKLEEKRTDLKKKYFKELKNVLSTRMATRFIQVDNQINMLLDLQLASRVPLVQ